MVFGAETPFFDDSITIFARQIPTSASEITILLLKAAVLLLESLPTA
jgi:hypothetical protein